MEIQSMVRRYNPHSEIDISARCVEDPTGEWVRHEDVLAAIQTLIDQLANNHEWRNGAVLAYNAISCSEADRGAEL
jgi:hypothetical protein